MNQNHLFLSFFLPDQFRKDFSNVSRETLRKLFTPCNASIAHIVGILIILDIRSSEEEKKNTKKQSKYI